MARVRKPQPTLESICFSTPEQKVLRFLLSEPTTTFTPRVISSKLKGIRGLGGIDGIMKILAQFGELGLVEFCDNQRSVRLRDDAPSIKILKTFTALCDLDGLRSLLEPISTKGILFGSRAEGKAASDSTYDLCVVSDSPEQVRRITEQHPIGRQVELSTYSSDDYNVIERKEPSKAKQIDGGIIVWGSSPWG